MLNCMGLATVQRGHMRPVCLLGSAVSMEVQSGCGQVNVGFCSSEKIANSAVRVNGLFVVE